MLGKEKDLNIQPKPQQIPETKQIKKKSPPSKKKHTPFMWLNEFSICISQRQESTMHLRQST